MEKRAKGHAHHSKRTAPPVTRLMNDVMKLKSGGKLGIKTVQSTLQHRRKVAVPSHEFSNPLYVGAERKQASNDDDERRGQINGHPRLKRDSSISIFEGADEVERNVGRVFAVALVQMYC